ncbi:type II secretion system protein E (GspE) [Natranaerovirga pectinivora]|uniref:Type II secretion system protein E (GspE) n=1 Tax=Natranaerovirga pectinivora TaxID=682400 RepID=A0A4R3MPW2_9FIRM|nr:ATPase, T2SS/T4P/T4SS family [Natranaerovirga pectinivora]TCT16892.1 type II secretion system protein E (GspE) [Natranaerovirga pectinivora]
MIGTRKKLRLGDLLIEYGLMTQQQLDEALARQKQTGGKLGEILINMGIVTKQNINQILEFQLGIPYVDLKEYQIDPVAVQLVSEILAKKHRILPIRIKNNDLYVAMEDPLDIIAIDDISLTTSKNIIPMLSSEEQINESIELYYGKEQAMAAAERYKQENIIDFSELDESIIEDEVKSAPIVKLVNTILEQSIVHRASDIHIEPMEKVLRVRFRIDGNLKEMMEYDSSLLSAIVARIKITSGMDIAEKRKPQDGRINIKVDKKKYDIRVSSLPTVFGEKIVMRITSKEGLTKGKGELGFSPEDLQKFNEILSNPHGIILVTGPTGSGKSTTLYTALSELNSEDINIVTVEDPVEANIEGINQVQVNTKAGLNFSSALRSILRQDPDIIMIGEIRDTETAEIAVKASITGHLVVSTLHTNSATGSITRLIDMGIEPFLLGASVVGVIAQRLVRKLCTKCMEPYTPNEFEKKVLNIEEDIVIHKANGCHICNHAGYSGRIGVYEIMKVSNELRTAINDGVNASKLKEQAIKDGMKTLKTNAIELVLKGVTSFEEMVRIAYEAD